MYIPDHHARGRSRVVNGSINQRAQELTHREGVQCGEHGVAPCVEVHPLSTGAPTGFVSYNEKIYEDYFFKKEDMPNIQQAWVYWTHSIIIADGEWHPISHSTLSTLRPIASRLSKVEKGISRVCLCVATSAIGRRGRGVHQVARRGAEEPEQRSTAGGIQVLDPTVHVRAFFSRIQLSGPRNVVKCM